MVWSRTSVAVEGECVRAVRWIVGALLLVVCLPSGAQAAAPDWFAYTRPPAYGVKTTWVRVPMRDGVTLGCRLSVPARGGVPVAGRFPGLIYENTPYAALAAVDAAYPTHGEWFARRGYQALLCNVRGTGRSGGFFPYNNQPAEWQDSYDLVEWLAAQPGSDGRIGQTGESYGAMTTFQAGIGRPPHLVAIAPQQAPADLYEDDVYPGGIKRTPVTSDWWPIAAWASSFGDIPPGRMWNRWLAHPRHDAFWEGIAIRPKLGRVQVPALVIGGWDDPLFSRGTLRDYEELVRTGGGDRTWLVYGPWEHATVTTFPSCVIPGVCVKHDRLQPGVLLAWFDHWLKQLPEAPLPSARVTTYEGPRAAGGRGWEEVASWPPPDAARTVLALRADARLGGEPGPAGVSVFTQRPTDGLRGQLERLRFTSEPLEEDRVLAGDITLRLRARYSAGDANLRAALAEVRADGSARRVSSGWLRVSHRRSSAFPSAVTPGELVDADIELRPTHRRLLAGSRLVVSVSGLSALEGVPQPRPVRTSVATGVRGSTLEVTVRGGTL